jgi:arginyl-tRNA synthetase
MNTIQSVRRLFAASISRMGVDPAPYLHHVRVAQNPKFGDYQVNCAMPLAKELRAKPRDVAQKLIDGLPSTSEFETIKVEGPGFVNLRLSGAFVRGRLASLWSDPRLGVCPIPAPRTMVIDYSSPNVAKPMHVGHLRSTIIGDALARIHRALGWNVIADNHLGDWGTQFGMLIYGWRNLRDETAAKDRPLQELARLYKTVNALAETNEEIARACRAETARLHAGNPENLALWEKFMPWCLADLETMYRRLDVRFDCQYGESRYQPMLADVVARLKSLGVAEESDGAVCIFFPDPTGAVDDEGKVRSELPPTIIQKSDGAFTYAASDLACIQFRVETFHPDVIVYVVDDRQSLHFQQVFAAARKWGYVDVELRHVAFGKITGKDGRPFKTREGGTIGLETLLDEAVERARRVVDENSPDLSDEERASIAEVVGLGAVKYADLSQNRLSDYVFDWDKMISLQGDTAAYLQYVYARNRSIFRKGGVDPGVLDPSAQELSLDHPSERALAIALLQFGEAVAQAAEEYKPNVLTRWLYDAADAYNGFFRDCRVLQAETDALRRSRLVLCELTARMIRRGLELLGIRVVERM